MAEGWGGDINDESLIVCFLNAPPWESSPKSLGTCPTWNGTVISRFIGLCSTPEPCRLGKSCVSYVTNSACILFIHQLGSHGLQTLQAALPGAPTCLEHWLSPWIQTGGLPRWPLSRASIRAHVSLSLSTSVIVLLQSHYTEQDRTLGRAPSGHSLLK